MHGIMRPETVWISAYNAALTGLLASKSHTIIFSAINVHDISDQCKAFADQALKDFREHLPARNLS